MKTLLFSMYFFLKHVVLPTTSNIFSLDLVWWDFIMQEQVHHIFVDGIAYCLYETCMKKNYF